MPAALSQEPFTDIPVTVGATPTSRADAIRAVGQLLVATGKVDPAFVDSMLKREETATTYLGSGVAIPHGLLEDKGMVKKDGIAVLQAPGGVEWQPGKVARFIVGIAAASDGHLAILRRLTGLLQDEKRLDMLCSTPDASLIRAALAENPCPRPAGAATADFSEKITWTLDYPAGLHARPAAAWVAAAKAAGMPLRIRCGAKVADPRNLVALLQLGASNGSELTISAEGPEAATALASFRNAIAALSAEEKKGAARAEQTSAMKESPAASTVAVWTLPGAEPRITGIAASSGLVIGRIRHFDAGEVEITDLPGPLAESGARLQAALNRTRQQMKALADDTERRLGASDAAIFRAQAELLDDTDIITDACRQMIDGHGVAWSWHMAVENAAQKIAALDNPLVAARAADLRDVGRRVLLQLDPDAIKARPLQLGDGAAIILARDMSPSDTATLDPARVAGMATAFGGPTAHTAILARTLGIAALVAGGEALLAVPEGALAILDGDNGRLWVEPSPEALKAAEERIARIAQKRAAEAADRSLPAVTKDGLRIEVAANINRPDQAALAIDQGAEGVGLMRTEFLFLEKGDTPGEDEQFETYRAMAAALDGRSLIVRALDIGGDKQVAHLDLPREDNPFLGVRGARLLLRRADLFTPQMRALYRAAKEGASFSVMFPMVTSVAEAIELRRRCEALQKELDAPQLQLGVMIEVPAAAVLADRLAAHVDFFSIGTNDLTQYALAMDRQNPALAAEADPLHPAVLRLVSMTVDGAKRYGRRVGVCGGIAGEPFGAALLAGLGVQELSMTPRDIPAVKAMLRNGSGERFAALAQKALALDSAAEVRALSSELAPAA